MKTFVRKSIPYTLAAFCLAGLRAHADVYLEQNGLVVVEAEHFDVRAASPDGHHYHIVPDEDGGPDGLTGTPPFASARGGKYMQNLPDSGQNRNDPTQVASPPFMEYKVLIQTTGQYRLYARWGGWDGGSDSGYFQIMELIGTGQPRWYRGVGQLSAVGNNNNDFDNCADLGNGNVNIGTAAGWNGVGAPESVSAGGGESPMLWTISTPGVYTVRVSQREDGAAYDAILLQLASKPEPTSGLVPESPVATNAPLYVRAIDPANGSTGGRPDQVVSLQIVDGSTSAVTNSIQFNYNGTNVAASISQTGRVTYVSYAPPPFLPPGSANTTIVTFKDSAGTTYTNTWSFTVAPYVAIPAADALPAGTINTNNSGFQVFPYQTAAGQPNDLGWTEDQFAGFQGANVADLSLATTNASYSSGFQIMPLVNWNNNQGGTVDGFAGADSPPGITGANGPGGNGSQANYSEEVLTFLSFPAPGVYTMGVNSDDGFRVYEGPNPKDHFARNLGQFNGGRGSADTTFQFVISQAGIYPFRLIYEQGGGGANCSWFTVTPAGQKVLVNDTTSPDAIRAYYSSTRIGAPYLPPYTVGNWQVTSPLGFSLTIGDGATPVNAASVQVKVDGQTVSVNTTHTGEATVISYTANPPFALNSGHAVSVSFADGATPANTRTYGFYLFVSGFASIPGGYAVPSADTTKPGFKITTWQTDQTEPNTLVWMEDQLAGLEGTNQANLTGADASGYFYWSAPVNFNITPASAGGNDIGDFQAPNYPDAQFPGLPGTAGNGTDNSSMEVLTFLQFPASGIYTMGVNSDDGFKVSTAANPKDRAGVVLGSFNGGRGAADTTFRFYVPQSGIYPLRLIWENGTGGANCEWFTVQNGKKVLINDSTNPDSLKSYAAGPATGPSTAAYISYVKATAAGVMIRLTDASTTVDSTTVKLSLNGNSVSPSVSKSSGVTTVNYAPTAGVPSGFYSVTLTYSDGASETRTFPITVPAGGGSPLPDNIVASGGYAIGLNLGANENGGSLSASAVAGVPSVRQANWNNISGGTGGPQGNVVADTNGTAAATSVVLQWASPNTWESTGRGEENNGGFTGADHTLMTGYLDSAGNGTTTVGISGLPPELTSHGYDVYIYLLGGVTGRGGGYFVVNSDNQQPLTGIVLAQYPANPATYVQVPDVELPANSAISGGVASKYGVGDYILFTNLTATNITVEASTDDPFSNGSTLAFGGTPRAPMNAIQLVSDYRPIPYIVSSTIQPNQVNAPVASPIQIVIADGASPVSNASLAINGATVNATTTKTNNLTTIAFTPSPALSTVTQYSLTVVYSDASKSYTNSWSFTTSPLGTGTLFIEGEDFNFNHGQWLTNASLGLSGPYNVGAYQGLGNGNNGYFGNGSDYGIDFNTDHNGNPSAVYRPTTPIGTEVAGNSKSRGLFSVTNNWDVGWNDLGDWYNYTRSFPAGNYLVYASLSSGGADIHAELDQVSGAANTINQTLTKLGTFDALTTGGWQNYALVPLLDANNKAVQVNLNGTTTLRFTVLPGNLNLDYFAFLPVSGTNPPPPTIKFTAIQASGANVTLTWTGGGTLQQATSASGTWTPVAGASSPATVSVGSNKTLFFRVQQ